MASTWKDRRSIRLHGSIGKKKYQYEGSYNGYTDDKDGPRTCVTPKVIANMKEKMESPEEMEGFDSLRDEDAEKVRKAWENGEIPEEDRPKKTEK